MIIILAISIQYMENRNHRVSTVRHWKKNWEKVNDQRCFKFNDFFFFFYSLRITRFELDRMCYNWHRLPFLSEIDDGPQNLIKENDYRKTKKITKNYSTKTLNEQREPNNTHIRTSRCLYVCNDGHTRDTRPTHGHCSLRIYIQY